MNYLLSLVIFSPAFGALVMGVFLRGELEENNRNAKLLTLVTTLATLIFSFFIVIEFDPQISEFQLLEEYSWILGLTYKVGVDGISVPLILLTTSIMPIVIIASWSINIKVKQYMVCFLLLESLIIGVFCSLDLVLFYLFFESGLIPMFLIIGIWGGANRVYAAFKFFLYTLLGSILMLFAMLYMWLEVGTTDIPTLSLFEFDFSPINLFGFEITGGVQTLLWLAFFASFAVKLPMWPFHTWLPDAHVEAPTVGSIILAGILLKVGGYAFLRLSLPILPDATFYFADFMIIISIISIIYTSFVAIAQDDIKKMIAYSSVAHMGYVTAGIFSLTEEGINGAIFQMVSHGIVSSALFLSIGFLYEQTKSREIKTYSFLVKSMPTFSFLFVVIVLSSIGLPGTSGFIGELLSVLGVYKYNGLFGFLVATGLILGAIYMLRLVREIIFTVNIDKVLVLKDLILSERLLLLFFAITTLLLGIFPNLLLNFIDGYTLKLIANF